MYFDEHDERDDRPATESEAHVEWHINSGVPMGTPGCPQDACHVDDVPGDLIEPPGTYDGIRIDRVNDGQIVVRFDRPGRVEITGGKLIAFAYEGVENDLDQEPMASFTFDAAPDNSNPQVSGEVSAEWLHGLDRDEADHGLGEIDGGDDDDRPF